MIRVYTHETDGQYTFFADNAYIIPVWISLEFPSLVNMRPTVPLPVRTLLPAQAREIPLFSLEKSSGAGRRSYKMSLSYAKGDPAAAQPDGDFIYLFPFAHGSKHKVTQGYNGSFTHQGDNLYALDFDLDSGTPVYAARSGLVVEVKKDSSRGGPNFMYNKDANFISILHSDGTIANYVHLQINGAVVSVGQAVQAGQHIGYSGNTGVSSGPHLHFDVQIPTTEGKMRPIPVRFLNYDGKPVEAQEGGYYYATHPGGAVYSVVFGNKLREEDFQDYHEPTEPNGKIDLRVDRIDDTYMVFVSNGTGFTQDITVGFSLRNLTPSRRHPLTLRVPARTEKFLIMLQAAPRATAWQYGYSIKAKPVYY
jgi:murein DD-endopeptidase MepM/ murein hydrolase activator NlpD